MKWATRDHLHLDRVACSWLVLRFLDSDADLSFVDGTAVDTIPAGTVTFGIAGGTFTPHDERGTAFAKMLRHYRDSIPPASLPALDVMAEVVDAGVKTAIGRESEIHCSPDLKDVGAGLAALSEGFMFCSETDQENVELSSVMYDALFAFCAGYAVAVSEPEIASMSLMPRLLAIKARLQLA